MAKERLEDFATQAGISVSFASQIINKRRIPTIGMSLKIYDATGRKFGLIEGATRAEIATLTRMARRTDLMDRSK